jgi:hypothetical protein
MIHTAVDRRDQVAQTAARGVDGRRRAVLSRCLSGPSLLLARLKADPTFTSEAARVRAFVQSGKLQLIGAGVGGWYFFFR